MDANLLERVREYCLGLPEATERLSHGAPSFFVRDKRQFAMVVDDHHGDGRFAIWCPAPSGAQQALVGDDPECFFVPPYVGWRGWVGVRLDRGLAWEEIEEVLFDAYLCVASPKLAAEAVAARGGTD